MKAAGAFKARATEGIASLKSIDRHLKQMADVIEASELGWIIDPAILYESPGRSLRHTVCKRSENANMQSNSTFLAEIEQLIAAQTGLGTRARIVCGPALPGSRRGRDPGCLLLAIFRA